MFATSSQRKFWTFQGTTELSQLRAEANAKYIAAHRGENVDEEQSEYFLTPAEERTLCRHYEYVLREFCVKFQPPMPRYVLGTSMMFFKRFYLHNSAMDYHPKDILYTCVYLACKVEEFNVSVQQFVANVHRDPEQASDIILSQELLLMQQLHYHLTVHNPFRPLEGLLIDIKTRCPRTMIDDPEKIRKGAEDFLDKTVLSDVGLIFAPSQMALAAVLSGGAKIGVNLDSYVANTLLGSGGKENLLKTVESVKRIRYMVNNGDSLNREEVKAVERKLEHCRNQENNPDSDIYQQKVEDLWEEEEERRAKKRIRLAEEGRRAEQELLNV